MIHGPYFYYFICFIRVLVVFLQQKPNELKL
jgi:hypothetical protein